MNNPTTPPREWLWTLGAIFFFALAVAGVASTWGVLSATVDEPYHVACGMEWLEKGTYLYEPQHPPLARVAVALVPFLHGARGASQVAPIDEGNAILYPAGRSTTNLTAARSGTLFFLVLAALGVFLWARRWFGIAAAFWSVLLFVNLPLVLAHAGLATVDMACTATVTLALYALLRCVEDYSRRKLVFLAAALAFAFLCKFSAIVFIGACVFVTYAYFAVQSRGAWLKTIQWRRLAGQLAAVSAIVFVLLWAGYRFEATPLANKAGDHAPIDRAFANKPLLRRLAYAVVEAPIPLRSMARGLYSVKTHDALGHPSYFLGEFRVMGWWYFFPVLAAVKTPIGFLILCLLGLAAILFNRRSDSWQQRLTALFPIVILLVCMRSHLNLGLRHALPLFPFLAIAAGYAVTRLLAWAQRTSPALAAIPLLLAAWVVADCWMARPDYLTYFNQFAGSHPEYIEADSDLDWGQDLGRLSRRLKELGIPHTSILYFGTAPLEKAGLPPYTAVPPDVPIEHGYLAVSVRYLTFDYARDRSTAWIKRRTPQERIGSSIYLYNLDR